MTTQEDYDLQVGLENLFSGVITVFISSLIMQSREDKKDPETLRSLYQFMAPFIENQVNVIMEKNYDEFLTQMAEEARKVILAASSPVNDNVH